MDTPSDFKTLHTLYWKSTKIFMPLSALNAQQNPIPHTINCLSAQNLILSSALSSPHSLGTLRPTSIFPSYFTRTALTLEVLRSWRMEQYNSNASHVKQEELWNRRSISFVKTHNSEMSFSPSNSTAWPVLKFYHVEKENVTWHFLAKDDQRWFLGPWSFKNMAPFRVGYALSWSTSYILLGCWVFSTVVGIPTFWVWQNYGFGTSPHLYTNKCAITCSCWLLD